VGGREGEREGQLLRCRCEKKIESRRTGVGGEGSLLCATRSHQSRMHHLHELCCMCSRMLLRRTLALSLPPQGESALSPSLGARALPMSHRLRLTLSLPPQGERALSLSYRRDRICHPAETGERALSLSLGARAVSLSHRPRVTSPSAYHI
jgi:hypothetical protein